MVVFQIQEQAEAPVRRGKPSLFHQLTEKYLLSTYCVFCSMLDAVENRYEIRWHRLSVLRKCSFRWEDKLYYEKEYYKRVGKGTVGWSLIWQSEDPGCTVGERGCFVV